ncbi:MAG: hypothetical protein CVT79_12330 [Alphaproteobacteria bacterium HGW-Alphaproteobacteria-18]|nr:MAG: hypothetical protein CVT79_12330 [Alphaproteobacteria bacterium HGW-Alphaproteobacteria-18]
MSVRLGWLIAGIAVLSACASVPAPELGSEPAAAVQGAAAPGLRVEGNRIFLVARVQGVATEALLDSGAEMTLVDAGFAAGAGLLAFGEEEVKGTGAGTESVQFAQGVTLEAAGKSLPGQMVAILDLTDISERVVGHPLTVILGRELFDAGIYALDVDAGRFEEVAPDAVPTSDPLPLSEANGIKQIGISVNGIPVQADFDLGNGSEVLLSQDFADRAGLLAPGTVLGTKQGGGIGGPVERTLVRVETLEVGGLVFRDITAAVSPQADGGAANIGVSVLRNFNLVIDFAGNRVWLEPRA